MRPRATWAPIVLASTAMACAPALSPRNEGGDAGMPPPSFFDASVPPVSGAFRHSVDSEGVVTTMVDASDAEVWQRLDLDTGLATDDDGDWDLAFSRFRIRSNGGVSGSGGVQVAVSEIDFDALVRAPDGGFDVDRAHESEGDFASPFANAFINGEDDWYDYDVATHTLTPKPRAYVVASTEGRYFALTILGYYDEVGSPAVLTFRWKEIAPPNTAPADAGVPPPLDAGEPPSDGGAMTSDASMPDADPPPGAIVLDASSREAWIYISVSTGIVTPTEPEASTEWDLAFRRTEIRTNSGTSGSGLGGARLLEASDFESVTATPTEGFEVDIVVTSERPGAVPTSVNPVLAGWYDYDPATHTVSPGARIYAIRTAGGDYAKLRIWQWRDGRYTLSLSSIAPTAALH